MAGKCVILVGKKTQVLLDAFYGREKSRKRSGFVFYSYLNTVQLRNYSS